MRSSRPLLLVAVVALGLLLLTSPAGAQELSERVARGSLRPYWHVFIAYAVGWVLVLGWIVSIARRIARLEQQVATARE